MKLFLLFSSLISIVFTHKKAEKSLTESIGGGSDNSDKLKLLNIVISFTACNVS